MSLPEMVRLGKTPEVQALGRAGVHQHYDGWQVVRLLRDGMSCNAWGHTGKAPLHIAAAEGYVHLIDILLQAKADIDRQTGVALSFTVRDAD